MMEAQRDGGAVERASEPTVEPEPSEPQTLDSVFLGDDELRYFLENEGAAAHARSVLAFALKHGIEGVQAFLKNPAQ